MINGIGKSVPHVQPYDKAADREPKDLNINNKEENEAVIFERNTASKNTKVTYDRPRPKNVDSSEIERLIGETEQSYQALRDLIERLISRQGKSYKDLLAGKDTLFIDDEARAEAKLAISEDGPLGIKAVSDRLVDFAIAASGNDKGKIGEIKNAIAKGFKEAERILGGALPDISQKTYDETMRKLDEWANSEG